MQFNFVSKDVALTPAMRKSVEEKLAKFDNYFSHECKAVVTITILPNRLKAVEVGMTNGSFALRAKTINEDFYNAVDILVEKLEGQMRKVKTQLKKSSKQKSLSENIRLEQIEEENNAQEIVKRKKLSLTPMDVDEALARMDALGHKFFIYLDSESGKVNVLYEIDDGSYGDIEVE